MSLPTTRRRNTVHDFSSLRLHPDGTRVPINSPTRVSPDDSRTHNTVRDVRGNRVARDAAGLRTVPKRPTVMREGDNTDEEQNAAPRVPRWGKKRRRILDDHVEFLEDSRSVAGGTRRMDAMIGCRDATSSTNGGAVTMNWHVPSSVRSGRAHSFPSIHLSIHSFIHSLSHSLFLYATSYHSFLFA
jgi:hypothetical protein